MCYEDTDLGEGQGNPSLPEERSLQGAEESQGPLRNQNLQMDLVEALMIEGQNEK